MKILEIIILFSIAAFMGFFIAYGYINKYPYYIFTFPLVVFMLTLLFISFRMFQLKIAENILDENVSEKKEPAKNDYHFIQAYGLVFLILPCIYVLGFQFGIPLYVLIVSFIFKLGWKRSIILSIFSYLFISLVFVSLLGTSFPKGVLLTL